MGAKYSGLGRLSSAGRITKARRRWRAAKRGQAAQNARFARTPLGAFALSLKMASRCNAADPEGGAQDVARRYQLAADRAMDGVATSG